MSRRGELAPTNMEDWQRRLKAEKEAERSKKTESAQILHGYQGAVSDADLKLKSLKEIERQKKTESAELMHNYHGGVVSETDMMLKNLKDEERKKLLDAQENWHRYKVKEIEITKKERPPQQEYPLPVTNGRQMQDPTYHIAEGSVTERALKFASQSNATFCTSPPSVPRTSHAVQGLARLVSPETVASGATSAAGPEQEAATSVEQENHFISNWNVQFSFGLVTAEPKPELTKYMIAVRDVVSKLLNDGITVDPSKLPFVTDQYLDALYISRSGRDGIRRIVVQACVPVLLREGTTRENASNIIGEAIQVAIQSGELLTLSQGS